MSLMGIAAIIVGVMFAGMLATIKVQHSNNVSLAATANTALAGKKTAEAANTSLAASISSATQECTDTAKKLTQLHSNDEATQKKLSAMLALKNKVNADQITTIQILDGQAKQPQATTPEASCKAADTTLKDLSQWRLR